MLDVEGTAADDDDEEEEEEEEEEGVGMGVLIDACEGCFFGC